MLYDGRRTALDDIIAEMLLDAGGQGGQRDGGCLRGSRDRQAPQADQRPGGRRRSTRRMSARCRAARSKRWRRSSANYLQEQQRATARRELIADLRKSGPAVRVMFEAPRANIAVDANDPSLGPASAPVTIVEFSDFQCPFCQRAVPTLKQVRAKYGDKVRIVWKDFPLTQIHAQAFKAAEGSRCAGEQGKFWEFHDHLFANQQALQPEALKKYAERPWPRCGEVRQLPRLVEIRRDGAERRRRRSEARRELDADALHQRPRPAGCAAARSVFRDDRRRVSQGEIAPQANQPRARARSCPARRQPSPLRAPLPRLRSGTPAQ